MTHGDPGWLAAQPLARAQALPAAAYLDPAIAAAEARGVLRAGWQFVAPAETLARPGDFVATEAAGVPLVLVRDEHGELRALVNVCRHRGAPLAVGAGSGLRALVCRYHGWSYALDGRLRGARGMREAQDFDPDAVALPRLGAAQWQGLVFVALDADAPPFATWIADVDARLAAAGHPGLHAYRFHRRVSYEVACNWKVYVENYLEGCHLPLVHARLNAALAPDAYRIETAPTSVLQWSPLDAVATRDVYAAGEALYWWLHPTTMLNVLPGRLQTNRVVPLAIDRCRVDFDCFYAPGTPAARIAADMAFADEVQAEDAAICAEVQRGLASGLYAPGRLHPREEAGVHRFHELWRAAMRAELQRLSEASTRSTIGPDWPR